MSFSGARKPDGNRGAKPCPSKGSSREESPSNEGGQQGWGTRRSYPSFMQQRSIASHVTVRASCSNSRNSARKSPTASGSKAIEQSMDRSIDEVEFQAQQVVSLNSPRQPTQHVQKDMVERPRKPLTLNKPWSPTVKAWTEGTSLSEIILVSLPTQETAVGDLTNGNQSKETQEAQGVLLYAHDSMFMNDSGESEEGVQSFLLQPVIQGESRNDAMGPSFRVSNMDAPTRSKEASQMDSLAQIVELMKQQAEMFQSIEAGIKDKGKAMNHLHEKFDEGWYQPSRQSS